MRFRKLISICALLALMFGQVVLAQHNATHIDHGISFELAFSHNDEHHHQEEREKHQCPECVLTKLLQTAFYNVSSTLLSASQVGTLTPEHESLTVVNNNYKANSPRAPPAILI